MGTESWILTLSIVLFAAFVAAGFLADSFPLQLWIRTLRRWIRFAFFSLALALAAKKYFFTDESFVDLAIAGALTYILVETFIYWLQICAASVSGLPPFGKYTPAESAWSCEPSMIKLKRKIEALGFKKSGAFTVHFGGEVSAKSTFFDSADAKERLDVTFVPFSNTYIVSSSIYSQDTESVRWITDGNPTPMGLSSPKGCKIFRKRLACNPLKLIKIHESILKKSGKTFVKIRETPAEYVEEMTRGIESQSALDGLLNTGIDAEESGIFTQEGKTRIWIDMIKTNYFPFLK